MPDTPPVVTPRRGDPVRRARARARARARDQARDRLLAPLFLTLFTALACPTPARAVITTATSIYDFAGTCADCNGTATAELILSDYTLGDTISAANFISFAYGGTNLLAPFTIVTAQASGLSGTINNPVPGAQDVSVTGNDQNFTSQANGFWCVGGACYDDLGFSNTWSAVQSATLTATDAPEPTSLAILALPLIAIALRGRIGRRAPTRRQPPSQNRDGIAPPATGHT